MKDKIVLEVAEQEFQRFIDTMCIDANPADMDEDDKRGFDQQKERFVKAIQNGSLTLNDNAEPVFRPMRSDNNDPITFFEPTGASLMAMDRKKSSENVGKLYASMAEMTKTHASTFSRMKMADLKVCMAITTLFLG